MTLAATESEAHVGPRKKECCKITRVLGHVKVFEVALERLDPRNINRIWFSGIVELSMSIVLLNPFDHRHSSRGQLSLKLSDLSGRYHK
jgi:hypothetical protein